MEELRRLRKERGLTQAQLAVQAGLDPSSLSQIETGARRPNTRTLEKLAGVLGVEVAAFFPQGQSRLPDFEGGRYPQRSELRPEIMFSQMDASRRRALQSAPAEEREVYLMELTSALRSAEASIAESAEAPTTEDTLQLLHNYAARLRVLRDEAEAFAAVASTSMQGDKTA